jgi:hypothetical protein
MDRNIKAPQGRAMGPFKERRKDRADQSQIQYNLPAINGKVFDVDQHIRTIRRMSIDAYVMLKDWPQRIRFSYYVGSDGRLMSRSERRGGK